MKNRKIVIPLFIILIISFVTMIFFYVYKKHNDKVKLEEEKRLNEKIIKEKIDLINKNYGIFVDGKKIQSDDEIATFFNSYLDTHEKINDIKIKDITFNDINNPEKALKSLNDEKVNINNISYQDFKKFNNLTEEENNELEKIYKDSNIESLINDDNLLKETLISKIDKNIEFITFLNNNSNKYYVNGFDIIYKDENFANEFKKYSTKYNLLNEKNIGKRIPILMYHAVDEKTWGSADLFVKTSEFEKQMKYLHDNGYTTLFLSEIETAKNYDKPIIITFDDGYDNVYNNAFPIMKKYNIKSDLYLITRFNPRPLYVDTNMIKEMDASGIVEMGSHTLVHVNLAQNTYEVQENELRESQKDLETLCKLMGIPMEHHHRALEDVKATQRLYEKLEREFEKKQPDVFEPKPLLYKAKKQTPATMRQKKHLKELAEYHKIDLNLPWETLTRNEASRQVDKIISTYGRIPRD